MQQSLFSYPRHPASEDGLSGKPDVVCRWMLENGLLKEWSQPQSRRGRSPTGLEGHIIQVDLLICNDVINLRQIRAISKKEQGERRILRAPNISAYMKAGPQSVVASLACDTRS